MKMGKKKDATTAGDAMLDMEDLFHPLEGGYHAMDWLLQNMGELHAIQDRATRPHAQEKLLSALRHLVDTFGKDLGTAKGRWEVAWRLTRHLEDEQRAQAKQRTNGADQGGVPAH
jgi:hypothetical protein